MEGNNAGQVGAAAVRDWRLGVRYEGRVRVVNKIVLAIQRHVRSRTPRVMSELRRISHRFEETMYSQATSQHEYLRQISVKLLTLEARFQRANQVPPAPLTPPISPRRPKCYDDDDTEEEDRRDQTDFNFFDVDGESSLMGEDRSPSGCQGKK